MLKHAGVVRAAFIPLAALLAAGCSKPDDGKAATAVDVSVVPALFAEGFDSAAASADASGGAAVASTDPRAGIPFERTSRRTRQVEAALARTLDKELSLRFALADPAVFVTSGKARAVWEREMAARGFSADTVAGATALMFGVGWELSNGRRLSAADNAAILRQVTAGLRGNELERENDEERQVQADMRLTVAGLWLEEAYLRERDSVQMRELSDAVHRDLKRMSNNDMRATEITAEGFSD